ncbi:5'-methylthioadenosine phosphorylase [hydrothermal vent metagenome]|uniref:5'-methylthioadenosine phosphorylase n=1 Tax=hydrothermal vent metagenome TaxID=652676 RepID=A0A3B1BQC4_9ZZZZ
MTIGVIGGSGLYDMEGLESVRMEKVTTPFGDPSDEFVLGKLGDVDMVFLPRHGRGHRILPSELNFRANIWAMKSLGVERIISLSAVGSLKTEIEPGHAVVIDQFIDRTRGQRAGTFFGEGIVAHVTFADPVCGYLADLLYESTKEIGWASHKGGTYICMEGPLFSTRAESRLYRSWGADVIGMTNLQEAKLAREAEMCYATVALSTDYDCWREEDVTIEQILEVMKNNVERSKEAIRAVIPKISAVRDCSCKDALQFGIITDPAMIPPRTRQKLDIIIGKYIK